jgi:mono/diheme cytochrome c family protein
MTAHINVLKRQHLARAIALLLTFLAGPTLSAPPASSVDFNRDVRRILSENCFACHGPDAKPRKGGKLLRLDLPDSVHRDLGDGRQAIVPNHPEKSELVRRITAKDPDDRMPPPDSGKKLTARDIQTLEKWIREGAVYSRHWSYVTPQRGKPPAVREPGWPKNPIDAFVLARLDREKLKHSPEADRPTLIRRAALDLTGLPPTVEDVDQFLKDREPEAYERLIDRLLARPAFGEHWARLWLDEARYADSTGYADDPPRTIWAFRDYVIRSLNANKRFDQFTLEQLAGDLLDSPTDEQLVATAFHRNTLTNNEGGTNDEEYRNVAIVDRVNTTMAVWMGTTMACAQCHNHKYDPFTQEEYFRLFAILNNTADADRGDESPVLELYTPEQKIRRQQWDAELARWNKVLQTPLRN